MNTHDFHNLLEGKIELAKLNLHPHNYPHQLMSSYNFMTFEMQRLANEVREALKKMTDLENQQMQFLTQNYGKAKA